MKILLVEDEPVIAMALSLALELEGYDVVTATNGRKALESLDRDRPDAIVTDYMMPVMDGAALIQAIKADPRHQDIPIVVMSGAPDRNLRRQLDGVAHFIQKPFLPSNLVKTLRRLLGDGPDPPAGKSA